MKSWQEKLIAYGTYLLVLLTPIVYFGSNWYFSYSTSKTFFFYGVTEVIFAVWIYQAFVDKTLRLSRKNLLILSPFFAYVAWLTIAGIFGVDPGFSFWSSLSRGTGLLTLYHALALLLIICSLVGKHGLEKYGHKLMGWFIGGASLLTISVWLGNEGFNIPIDFLLKSKGGGLMGNSSLSATVIMFAMFFSVFIILSPVIKRSQKIMLSVALFIMIFSPLFIGFFGPISARGALLGIGVGVLSFIPFYLSLQKEKITKVFGFILIGLTVIGAVWFWHSLMSPEGFVHKKFSESATESRFIFWDISKEALHERPMLGFGPENYRVVYQKYFNPKIYTLGSSVEVWNDRAHNIIFENGIAGGYPAIALYLFFILSILFGIYHAFINGRISSAQASVLGGLVVAYFFQNLFVFDSVTSIMALMILVGILFGASFERKEVERNNSSNEINYILVFAISVTTIITLVLFVYLPVRKVVAISNVIEMPLNKRPDHYKDLLTGSPIGNAFEIGGIAEDSYKLYSDNQKEIKSNEKLLKYSLIDIQKFTQYLDEVRRREPNDYRLRLNLARLYNVEFYLSGDASRSEQAIYVENEALALSPNDPEIYWTKATTLYRTGDVSGAKEVLRKAIEIAPYIGFSQELLDQFSK